MRLKQQKQKIKNNKIFPNIDLELSYLGKGYNYVVGIDEVGRGAWAGPVVVAGFVFSSSSIQIEGVNDSKLLSAKKRSQYYPLLLEQKHHLAIGDVADIETNGISQTIISLITQIKHTLGSKQVVFLIDGYFAYDFGENSIQITKGDSKHYSIAAASVLAKCWRDEYMRKLSKDFPQFGFEKHVGYGTKQHRQALEKFGITPEHRKNYKPIAQIVEKYDE